MENQISGTSYLLELAGRSLAALEAEVARLNQIIQEMNAEKASTNGHVEEVAVPAEAAV